VIRFLKDVLTSQGFRENKGLQKQIAKIIDRDPSVVSNVWTSLS
jgi:hypothetical protein